MTSNQKDSEAIVRQFCGMWERLDLEGILGMLSPDIDYQNVPAPPMIGRDAARAFIAPIIEATTKIDFICTALAVSADGRQVLTERIDRLHYGDKVVVIPIMGIFEIEGGQITKWRDYADSASVGAQFAALKS